MKSERSILYLFSSIIITVVITVYSCKHEPDISGMPEVCFSSDVLPIFLNNCTMSGCHTGNGEELGLGTYSDIMAGITPGNASSSEIYKTIVSKWGGRMPPDKPLSIENRMTIRLWIEQGANQTTCGGANGGKNGGTVDYIARACFTRDILPVVVSHCATAQCHDAISHKEGYNFTGYTNIRNAVSPGRPSSSKLYTVITTSGGEDKMPPPGSPQLSTAQVDSIRKWITYGALNENCGEVCDTINPVTFSATLLPVLQLTCTGCHSGSAPAGSILLTTYQNVATVAANGLLMKSLNGNGVTRMPPSGPLSTCRIRQFQIWVNNGYQNN
jgi:hypothetical protein